VLRVVWKIKLLCLLAILVLGFVFPVQAAEEDDQARSPITIKTEVDRNKITLGDIFKYSIIITCQQNVTISWPGLVSVVSDL